jgi:O-antigen ligase
LGSKRAFSDNVISAGNIMRVASVYGHPNNLGLLLERIWPFALVCVLIPQWRSRTTLVWLGLCAVGLLLSFSRGAWLASGLATALICAWLFGATFIRRNPWLLVVIAAIGIGGILLTLLTRGTSTGSFDARILLWQESMTWLQQRPWGLGLGQFYFYHNPEYGHSIIDASLIGTSEQYAAHPHNLVLDMWLNLGPWGGIVVAILLWRAWQRSLHTNHTHWFALAAGVMLVVACVHGLVDQFYFVSDISYYFWMAICIIDVDTPPSPRL